MFAWISPICVSFQTPTLGNPIFVQGLPGFGNVGRIAAHLLIKFFDAKLFAELYSPTFPDYVSITPKGIANCHTMSFIMHLWRKTT